MRSLVSTGVSGAIVALVLASQVWGHDAWMAPQSFLPCPGDTVVVYQRFGHLLETESAMPLDRDLATRFVMVAPDTTIDLLSETAGRIHPTLTPLLRRALPSSGPVVLGLEHGFLTAEFSADAFTRHLELEELHEVLALREANGISGTDRERYRRSLKTLICLCDDPDGSVEGRPLGQELEILLMGKPCALAPGDTVRARVLFRGEPLADKLVWALNAAEGKETLVQKAWTNASGLVEFVIDGSGVWLLRLVHVRPCPDRPDADWESTWASYCFNIK